MTTSPPRQDKDPVRHGRVTGLRFARGVPKIRCQKNGSESSILGISHKCIYMYIYLVGGLEHFLFFNSVGNNDPN